MRAPTSALTAVAAAVALAACDGGTELVADTCEVAFGAASLSITVGGQRDAAATARCARSTPQVVYASSAPGVVGVDPRTGRVVGMGVGSATITARVPGVPNAVATLPVTVACAPFLVAPAVRPTSFVVVPGGSMQLTVDYVTAPCARAADTTFTFASSDTTVAKVTANGLVTAGFRELTQAAITVASAGSPPVRLSVPFSVSAALGGVTALAVSPGAITLPSADTARIRWSVTLGAREPDTVSRGVTFRTSDSCVARVTPDGLVMGGIQSGPPATITVASIAYPTVSQTIGVTVARPVRGPAFALRALTAVPTGDTVSSAAVRGTITATWGVQRPTVPSSGRVELWLAGRLAATATLARPAPGETFTEIPLTVNTAARDAAGAPLYPNGAQTLELRVTLDGGGVFAGCPGPGAGQTATVPATVTLANP